MKKIFFLLFTFSLGLLPAQNAVTGKWDLGVSLANDNHSYRSAFHVSPLSGIQVKRNFGAFSLRAGGEFTQEHYDFMIMGCFGPIQGGTAFTRENLYRIGIEKGFMIGKHFRVYGALDVAGIFTRTDEFITSPGAMSYQVFENSHTIALMPTLGCEYFINDRFSVSLETRMRIGYCRTRVTTVYPEGNVDSRPYFQTGNILATNRVSALTVHFRF